jgi:3-(3-hydroxy-phenyl)propionate hydroxylase
VEGRTRRKSLNGRLCPNAVLADGTRYDEATHSGFVLVTAVPLSPRQRAALAERGAEVVEAPGTGLQSWLASAHATAALVRPDHTVMRFGRDIASLVESMPRFTPGAA